jgi:hypothetical protein
MPNLDKPLWHEMQYEKTEAYETSEYDVSLYWQNEQILKKLTDILFAIKEHHV